MSFIKKILTANPLKRWPTFSFANCNNYNKEMIRVISEISG